VNAYNFSKQRENTVEIGITPNGEVPHFPAWAGCKLMGRGYVGRATDIEANRYGNVGRIIGIRD
jgi:hypothetical protein